ncbi:hypothetical protein [Klebsiella phage 05F01]|nr:hypothetical protein [Klebsiella phage 05F01]
MGERVKVVIERRGDKWYSLGKYFKRFGQCKKYVWSKGFNGVRLD